MKKILLIRPNVSSKTDGINTYCLALSKLFDENLNIKFLPIKNYKGRHSSLFNCVFNLRNLFREVKNANPDIVHINGYLSLCVCQAFWVAKILNKKIVYTAHWHPYDKIRRPIAGKFFFNILVRPLVRMWADVVITLNNEDTAYFSFFCKDRIRRIPHWLHFFPKSLLEERTNNSILFVGRLNDANKGVEHLFQLPVGHYKIHIVGSGDIVLREDMIRHVDISNEELFSLYRKASVVVIPSKYEAFSYVALEALMSGTPVLMTKDVRIADYLTNVAGVGFFKFGDYVEFNIKLKEMMNTIVDRNAICEIFDASVIRNKYIEIYGIYAD